jgi:hypothetical protein
MLLLQCQLGNPNVAVELKMYEFVESKISFLKKSVRLGCHVKYVKIPKAMGYLNRP